MIIRGFLIVLMDVADFRSPLVLGFIDPYSISRQSLHKNCWDNITLLPSSRDSCDNINLLLSSHASCDNVNLVLALQATKGLTKGYTQPTLVFRKYSFEYTCKAIGSIPRATYRLRFW